MLLLCANHGGAEGSNSTGHKSTEAQIRALDQPLLRFPSALTRVLLVFLFALFVSDESGQTG